MIDDNKLRAASAFVLALAMGVVGAVGAGVALWVVFGWPAAVGFWGVLLMVAAWVIMQSEA